MIALYKKFATKISDLPQHDNTIWVVELNDGTTIYQCDFESKKNTWLELKEVIESTDARIDKMWIKFRTHTEEVEVGPVMSFVRGHAFQMGGGDSGTFVIGREHDEENLMISTWRIPEIELISEEVRSKTRYVNQVINNG